MKQRSRKALLNDLLNSSDKVLFTRGACHIFAAKLNERFGYELMACRDKSNGIAHCYAIRNGEGIDAIGKIDRPCFHEDFKFVHKKDISRADLLEYFRQRFPDEESACHSGNKSFNQIAFCRAEKFINKNLDRFGPP